MFWRARSWLSISVLLGSKGFWQVMVMRAYDGLEMAYVLQ